VCIAALGLFAEPALAMRELRRALRPGAPALVVSAAQQWAQLIRWPEELAAPLAAALRATPAQFDLPDLGGDLAALLAGAGFAETRVRGFLLEPAAHPLLLELPLIPWAALRPLAAARLGAAELAACDALAAEPAIELVSMALAALARA
jgi:hypothetical protein